MSRSKLVNFNACWDSHPDIADSEHNPCRNKEGNPAHSSQCAIRLGIALKRAGVEVPVKPKGFKRLGHCWQKAHKGEQHVLRAEVLAKWLLKQRKQFGRAEKKVGSKWDATDGVDWEHFKGRKGIVFFKDFWSRKGKDDDPNPTGDHIDIWNGENQAGFFSPADHRNTNDYFHRSKQIWFWELPDDGADVTAQASDDAPAESQVVFVDADNRPLQGLQVTVESDGESEILETDEAGVVTHLAAGPVTIRLAEHLARFFDDPGDEEDEEEDEDEEELTPLAQAGQSLHLPDGVGRLLVFEASNSSSAATSAAGFGTGASPSPATPAAGASSSTYFQLDQLSDTWRKASNGKHFKLTPAEIVLKENTYKAHCDWGAGRRAFIESVEGLTAIPGGSGELITAAAEQMGRLLTAANRAQERSRNRGARATRRIGIGSAYRSAAQQFDLWDGRFYKYQWAYRKSTNQRSKSASKLDADAVARFIRSKTAAPGYSNHNAGRAVDFSVTVRQGGENVRFGAGRRAAWRNLWFFDWLRDNAGTYDFEPYAAEPWHWDYSG